MSHTRTAVGQRRPPSKSRIVLDRPPPQHDPEQIEANHEAFVRGAIVRSAPVDALLGSGAGLAAPARSQSETRKRRPRKR
jgi:hypothetical protein